MEIKNTIIVQTIGKMTLTRLLVMLNAKLMFMKMYVTVMYQLAARVRHIKKLVMLLAV